MNTTFLSTLLFASLIAGTGFAKPVSCVDADKSPNIQVSGTIKKVSFEHPNGSRLTAYMLQLDQPVCYTQSDLESGKIQALQDSEIQITGNTSSLVDGTRVKLTGSLSGQNISAYYLSETAITIK